MKTLSVLMALIGLATAADAEDWECVRQGGCTARINEDGVLKEVDFRDGDLVQTEAGWVVSPDDGWEKVDTSPPKGRALTPPPKPPPSLAVGGGHVLSGTTWGGRAGTCKVTVTNADDGVRVKFKDVSGTSPEVPGAEGEQNAAGIPTCSSSDVATTPCGRQWRVGPNGKVQRKNARGEWVDQRRIEEPGTKDKQAK